MHYILHPSLLTYKMFLLLNRDHHGLFFCLFFSNAKIYCQRQARQSASHPLYYWQQIGAIRLQSISRPPSSSSHSRTLFFSPTLPSSRANWLHEFIHFYFFISSFAWIHSFPNAFSVCLIALIHSFHLSHQIPENHLHPNFQTRFLHF